MITERADDDTARTFVDHLHKHGVAISGCNVGGADLRTPEGVELTERRIRFAARWFGVKVCVTGAGQPQDAPRRTIVANLRRLGDAAAEVGITLALETHKGPTQNAAAMLALMAEVEHPGVRLNFDTGNIAYYNRGADPCDELEKVKHLVHNVHLKDNRGGFEDWYFPAAGRRRQRRLRPGSRDPRQRRLRRARTRSRSRALAASPSRAWSCGKSGSPGA